jgi:hypothetical protein
MPQLNEYEKPNIDAGGRVRVGQLTTLGDLKTLNVDDTLLWESAGNGQFEYQSNKMQMSVTSGQYCIRKSKQYFPYFSGKSHMPEFTFDKFHPQSGVIKRVGYYSSSPIAPYDTVFDGYFLESNPDGVYLKMYNFGEEILNLHIKDWYNKNIVNYQWENFTVLFTDFLWLGGANLKIWIKKNESLLLAHYYNYAGTKPDTFMRSPNQPVRYEIRSIGGSGTFRSICSSVNTEGSVQESGKQRSVNTGHVPITFPTVGTKYALLGIRKNPLHRDRVIKNIGMGYFTSSNSDRALVTLELNPTLSASLEWSDVPESSAQFGLGAPTIIVTSTGIVLFSQYMTQNAILPPNILEEDFLSSLGITIDNVPDELVVCVTPITTTVESFGALIYKEY